MLVWGITLLCEPVNNEAGAQMTSLETVILDILETKQPENVKELVKLVQEQVDVKLEDIENEVKSLHLKGLISLEEPASDKEGFISFLSQRKNLWFWIIIVMSFLSFASIMLIPETGTHLSYVRYVFGFVLVSFLPGYCLTEILFPKRVVLDTIERLTFSIGLSYAVTALVGLFLSITPFGLNLTTALLTLGSIVIVFALVALNRRRKTR